MSNAPRHGAAAAVDRVVRPATRKEREAAARQAMLPLAPAGEVEAAPVEAPAERRGPGRPPGAVNRRTAEWTAYLLGRFQSPLVAMAEAYSRPTAELARELGCTKAKAFELQMQAARDLAPYLHQRQPQAVQLDANHQVVMLTIADPGAAAGAGDGGGMTIDVVTGGTQRNQGDDDA